MTTKTKVIISIVVIAVSFASGRYSVPSKIIEKTEKTETVEKNKKKTNLTKTDKKKTTTITKNEKGEEITTIVEEEIKDNNVVTDSNLNKTESDKTYKEIVKSSPLSVSLLAGTRFAGPEQYQLNYGLLVSKQFLGPITAGAFGFSNGMVGLSLGLNF